MTMRSAQSKEKLQAYGLQQLHPAQARGKLVLRLSVDAKRPRVEAGVLVLILSLFRVLFDPTSSHKPLDTLG